MAFSPADEGIFSAWLSFNGARVDLSGSTPTGGATPAEPGVLYATELDDDAALYRIDDFAGSPRTRLIGSTGLGELAIAIDPTTRVLYAIRLDGRLYRLDAATGAAIAIGDSGLPDPQLVALVAGADGTLYAWDSANTNLYRIHKLTGRATRVGATGFRAGGDLAFAPDGTLYGSTGTQLVRIDPATGHATLVGSFRVGSVWGLAFDRAGTLYAGRDTASLPPSSRVYHVDRSTGAASPLGASLNRSLSDLALLPSAVEQFHADFTWAPAQPRVGDQVQFTDRSTGRPTSWSWDLNGIAGDDSRAQNPTWIYTSPGAYSATLTACNASSCSSRTRVVSVAGSATATIVISGPVELPALSVAQFKASAIGCNPTRFGWLWSTPDADLGDGGPLLGTLGTPAVVHRGWTTEGPHTVEVRNPGCPNALPGRATVNVGPWEDQSSMLHPRRADVPPIPLNGRTVIFCHGWQPTASSAQELWSCMSDPGLGLFCDENKVSYPVDDLLPRASLGFDVHGLQFTWSKAFTGLLGYFESRDHVVSAARRLSAALERRLPDGYLGPIQFVGHSLGSAVCALAAKQVLKDRPSIREVQITTLDRPDHVQKLGQRTHLGYGPEWLPGVFEESTRPGLTLTIDNYWSTTGASFGDQTTCVPGALTYNHTPLLHPSELAAEYFTSERDANDHSGVHEWYRWTMDANLIAELGGDPAACSGSAHLAETLDASLNPCAAGWNYSIVRGASVPQTLGCELAVTNPSLDWCRSAGSTACRASASLDLATADGAPEKAVRRTIDVPAFARAVTFDMTVSKPSSESAAVLLLDTFPLWLGTLGPFTPDTPTEIGPVPIDGLTGRRQLTLKVLDGPSSVVVNNFRAQRILPPCESESALCISSHRFRVEAAWTDHAGNSGRASPRYVSADESGFLWFFSPENLELVVKVLNACGSSHPRFWVFAAGLTDVEVRLKVTDTKTGAVRFYENPSGQAFQPVQDTDAFATCSSADVAASKSGSGTAAAGLFDDPAASESGLRSGRFEVRATWKTPAGATGQAHFVPLTDETGYLWFFDANNIEVALKIIDGCALNNRYWVFAAGLTNVQVDLAITDTQTGGTAQYRNPLNLSFQPIQDTSAFAACP